MKYVVAAFCFCLLVWSCSENGEEDCLEVQWYFDEDKDGLGRPDSTVLQCEQPDGFVDNGLDEDDEPFVELPSTKVPFIFTSGVLKPFYLDQTDAPYGFWFYAPAGYDSMDTQKHPLLIHLHGIGERGNSAINPQGMNIILWNGAPRLIKEDRWADPHSMIVVAPQASLFWKADELHEFIEFLVEKLHIDETRIYMTGLSFGGNGTFNYVAQMGSEAYVAAIAPIAGWGDTSSAAQYMEVPVWAFHGDADSVVAVQSSIDMIEAINAASPEVAAKLTIYPGVTHDSWARTYDGTGMGSESPDYDPFNMSLWDWMYQYTKE
ncbi:MAG: dienelactone hydrolase family protein [Cyclobacteriaceae bacterium]